MQALTHGLRRSALRIACSASRAGAGDIASARTWSRWKIPAEHTQHRHASSSHSEPPKLQPSDTLSTSKTDNTNDSPLVRWTVRTLSQEKLSPDDYIDLSDSRALAVLPPSARDPTTAATAEDPKPPIVSYGARLIIRKKYSYTPFPVNTRGFFYYRHNPIFPLGGSIRFRVLQTADPARWDEGQDLLNEHGTTWEFPLLVVAHEPRYALLRQRVIEDGSITPQLLEEHAPLVAHARTCFVSAQSQIVNEVLEPFYVELAEWSQRIFVPSRKKAIALHMNALFVAPSAVAWGPAKRVMRKGGWPFAGGRLICRLEAQLRYVRVERVRRVRVPVVVVRVVRIVEPVHLKDGLPRDAPAFADLPIVPGQLLRVGGKVVLLHLLGDRERNLEKLLLTRSHMGHRLPAERKPGAKVGSAGSTQARTRLERTSEGDRLQEAL